MSAFAGMVPLLTFYDSINNENTNSFYNQPDDGMGMEIIWLGSSLVHTEIRFHSDIFKMEFYREPDVLIYQQLGCSAIARL
jgi:hypothetical protein